MPQPPDGLPEYRLTGSDDEAFCRRVAEAIGQGYELHAAPVMAFDGKGIVVGQALVWRDRADEVA